MTTLRDIPAIRAEAERRAQRLDRILYGRDTDGERLLAWTEVQLDILTDLTDPDSRTTVARLVMERVGLNSSTGVLFHYEYPSPSPRDRDGAPYREDWPSRWHLSTVTADENMVTLVGPDPDFDLDDQWYPGSWVVVPGLLGVTDPAEALRLIALRVLGGES